MATISSNRDPVSLAFALARQYNELHDLVSSGTYTHRDQSGVAQNAGFEFPSSSILASTAPAAVDLPTTIALVNDLRGVTMVHFADKHAHLVSDTFSLNGVSFLNDSTFVTASTDLNSAIGTLTFMSTSYKNHFSSSLHHLRADTRPLTGSLNNLDISSAKFMANQMKSVFNSHVADGPTVGRIKLV